LVGRKTQGGGFVKELNTSLKANQIEQYILTGSYEITEEKESCSSSSSATSSSSSSSSSALSQSQQEEVEEVESVEPERRKVFLYDCNYLDSPVKDKSVDLLITDIPDNVRQVFQNYLLSDKMFTRFTRISGKTKRNTTSFPRRTAKILQNM